MKYVLRSIFVLAFAALAAAGVSVKSDAAGRTAYDGDWDVDIVTVHGDCQQTLRYSVRIAEGKVESNVVTYHLDGAVSPEGEIHVIVEEKGHSASGTGKLSHNAGHGLWHTSTHECTGHWKAERHVSQN